MQSAKIFQRVGLMLVLTLTTSLTTTAALAAFADQFAQGRAVNVEVFATVPYRSDGSTARINALTHSGDRIFAVVSHEGLIYEITDGTARLWFDVSEALGGEFNNSDRVEGGLRSVAFHPEFQSNGKVYTSQDQNRLRNPRTGIYISDVQNPQPTDSVVTEWILSSEGMFQSSRELFRIGQPGVHSIKQIAFNQFATAGSQDYGLLYIAHGDGGSVENRFSPHRNSALGKILRIDPQPTAQSTYTVPASNPFLSDDSVPNEVYALGFRNPHNFSFSRTGSFFVADIGSGNVEEINLVESGEDYGWGEREGRFSFINTNRGSGVGPLPDNDAVFGYSYPVASFRHEINHQGGLAIAGGYAVQNSSSLAGLYVFGEFGSTGELLYSRIAEMEAAVTKGAVRSLSEAGVSRADILFDHDGNASTAPLLRTSMLEVLQDSANYNAASNRADLRFGQGPDGEVYVTSKQNNTIYLITDSLPPAIAADTTCIDADGDGWGWNGVASCIAEAEDQSVPDDQTELPIAQCIDTDGDGWGWNGVSSCLLSSETANQDTGEVSTSGICIDNDGDGWGWNGMESCQLDTQTTTVESSTTTPGACIDNDGDGWGWNGVASCIIED